MVKVSADPASSFSHPCRTRLPAECGSNWILRSSHQPKKMLRGQLAGSTSPEGLRVSKTDQQ